MKTPTEKISSNTQSLDPFYLTIKEVSQITSLGKSSIYRLEKQGQFPKRLTLNKSRVVWTYTDVHAWCKVVKEREGYPAKDHYTF
ncbi:MAG: AlpA family phage regulatory protein [Oceanospirillaceae bacterium]|nr:AlpA family phage regulatory protein [Oceanospirillaceae bacterium]